MIDFLVKIFNVINVLEVELRWYLLIFLCVDCRKLINCRKVVCVLICIMYIYILINICRGFCLYFVW